MKSDVAAPSRGRPGSPKNRGRHRSASPNELNDWMDDERGTSCELRAASCEHAGKSCEHAGKSCERDGHEWATRPAIAMPTAHGPWPMAHGHASHPNPFNSTAANRPRSHESSRCRRAGRPSLVLLVVGLVAGLVPCRRPCLLPTTLLACLCPVSYLPSRDRSVHPPPHVACSMVVSA